MAKAPLRVAAPAERFATGVTSDPLFTHCCHCLNCQRQTGSAFVINLLIETDRLEFLAGDPQPVDVPRDEAARRGSSVARPARWRSSASTHFRVPLRPRRYARRSGRRSRPTSTSSRGRSCPGSRFLTLSPRSRSTTTRRSCGRPPASSASRRSWHRQAPRPDLSTAVERVKRAHKAEMRATHQA